MNRVVQQLPGVMIMYWSIGLRACAKNHFLPEICRFFGLTVASENPVPARYVSLWDAVAGNLLAHLALPEESTSMAAAYPYTLLFSNDGQALYCISSYPRPKLYIWSMEKAWVRLMEGGKEPVRTNKAKKR